MAVNKAWFSNRHPKYAEKGKAAFVTDLFTDAGLKTDHVFLVESFVEHEKTKIIAGEFKVAWQPPPVQVQRKVERSLALKKPDRDLIPVDVWAKYSTSQVHLALASF